MINECSQLLKEAFEIGLSKVWNYIGNCSYKKTNYTFHYTGEKMGCNDQNETVVSTQELTNDKMSSFLHHPRTVLKA